MKIKVLNISKNISRYSLIKAIKWYTDQIISPRMSINISLTISFVKNHEEKTNCNAIIYCMDKKYREFLIDVEHSLSKDDVLKVIAHEIVHMKQFAYKELKYNSKINQFVWKNKPHCAYSSIENNEIYWKLPWEEEAYGKGYCLYRLYGTKKGGRSPQ